MDLRVIKNEALSKPDGDVWFFFGLAPLSRFGRVFSRRRTKNDGYFRGKWFQIERDKTAEGRRRQMDHRVAMATTSEEFLESFFLYFFFLSEAVPGSAIKAAGQIGCRYHCQYSRYAIQSSFHFLTKKKKPVDSWVPLATMKFYLAVSTWAKLFFLRKRARLVLHVSVWLRCRRMTFFLFTTVTPADDANPSAFADQLGKRKAKTKEGRRLCPAFQSPNGPFSRGYATSRGEKKRRKPPFQIKKEELVLVIAKAEEEESFRQMWSTAIWPTAISCDAWKENKTRPFV